MATITGTAGADGLTGTSGADVIDGEGGIDTINAGAGDDIVRITHGPVVLGDPDFSLVDGGAGWDVLDLSGMPVPADYTTFVSINLAPGEFWIGQDDNTSHGYFVSGIAHAGNFEEVHLGPGASALILYTTEAEAPSHGFKVVGGNENDYVWDSRATDTIQSGGGDDTIQYWSGDDRIALGDGNDIVHAVQSAATAQHITVDGGAGSDLVAIEPGAAHDGAHFDLMHQVGQAGNLLFDLAGIEGASINLNDGHAANPGASVQLLGGSGDDKLESFFGTGSVLLLGREGNDNIDGEAFGWMEGQGAVTAYGGPGNDTVRGGAGADWLMGGGHYAGDTVPAATADDGYDTIWGEQGNDHIWGNSEFAIAGAADGRDQIDAGSGSDYVNGNAGDDYIMGGPGSDRLYGGAGNDWIEGDGSIFPGLGGGPQAPGNDHINGNKGDDQIRGGGGDDELLGGQGNDGIQGDDGNDLIDGGQGDDNLTGGAGLDTLTGGAGNDLFYFDTLQAGAFDGKAFMPDLITDFHVGEDQIDVPPFINQVMHPGSAADYSAAWELAKSVIPVVQHSHFQVLENAAAVQVGPDTYLFWDNYGNGPEMGARLANVSAYSIQDQSFGHFAV
ncbi:MAG: hypothetical protein JF628_07740 [Sphingomonas sp.]|nr:hypothetical protein [Sphingomonas sp.]